MEYRKCLVKSDKEVINMVYLKYTSKYVRFMLLVCDNLADFHTSCFLFKSFSSFPYLSRRAEISAPAEISPCNQPLGSNGNKLYLEKPNTNFLKSSNSYRTAISYNKFPKEIIQRCDKKSPFKRLKN